jgi:hypothetical protein
MLLLLLLLVQSCTCMARMQYPSTPPHTQVCRERGHHLLLLVHTEHTRMRTRLKQHTQQIGRKSHQQDIRAQCPGPLMLHACAMTTQQTWVTAL